MIDRRRDEPLEVPAARPVVEDRAADRELAADHGARGDGLTGLLDPEEDLLVEAIERGGVEARGDEAEAYHVQRRGREDLEVGARADERLERARLVDVLLDEAGEGVDA